MSGRRASSAVAKWMTPTAGLLLTLIVLSIVAPSVGFRRRDPFIITTAAVGLIALGRVAVRRWPERRWPMAWFWLITLAVMASAIATTFRPEPLDLYCSDGLRITLDGGTVVFDWPQALPPYDENGAWDATVDVDMTLDDASLWLPNIYLRAPAGFIILPLWTLLAVTALVVCLFYWRCRPVPRGHCQSCGYNLTGNVSGRCPECGKAV